MGAWLINDKGTYKFGFRYGDKLFKRSLKTKDKGKAEALLGKVNCNLDALEHGHLEVPDGADLPAFLLTSGKRETARPVLKEQVTLKTLFDRYQEALPPDAKAESSLSTERVHTGHLTRVLGADARVPLPLTDLQRYVNTRAKEPGRKGKRVARRTIEKELATLSLIWKWGLQSKLLSAAMPSEGLILPTTADKLPFMTRVQIEAKLARGGLSESEKAELWDALYLELEEIEQILAHVKEYARRPWVYPMFMVAAQTGARRSEILRSRVEDFDFDGRMVQIREKKREKGKVTYRHVPLSPTLLAVMREWFAEHPGGQKTISEGPDERVSVNMTNHHFHFALEGSDWHGKLIGWHVFRHSFASNCARRRVDQRMIDRWLGHTTAEMRRRYQHLFPDDQHEQLALVFS